MDTGINPAGSVAAALTRRIGKPISVTLTRNRKRLVSVRQQGKYYTVRIHETLAEAPSPVIDALARFVSEGCRESGRMVRDHLAATAAHEPPPLRPVPLRPAGRHHHLASMLTVVLAHFSGLPRPGITWGPRRQPGRTNIRLGSYDPKRRLIRINPVLDHPDVPDFVLRYVVWHELVHHQLMANGAGHGHGPHFSAIERRCPDMPAALVWQRESLWERVADARCIQRKGRPARG